MEKLENICDLNLLREMHEQKYIQFRTHPQYPELKIYGYTPNAQFDQKWNEVTNICRGLITVTLIDGVEYVLARGFNKFHNINTESIPETMDYNLPWEEPLATTKLDGSLGIIYFYDNLWRVATRGSFASPQAQWASIWLQNQPDHYRFETLRDADITPVVEIIYPENRIVVDYDFEGLVLLGLINNRTGLDMPRQQLQNIAELVNIPIVKLHNKNLQQCLSENIINEEGYVLTFSNGLKVKVKFENYVRLHRIVTGLNPKTVWEMMSGSEEAQMALKNLLEDTSLPSTFQKWLANWYNQLLADFRQIQICSDAILQEALLQLSGAARKDYALFFHRAENVKLASVCFAKFDKKPADSLIWKMIKPKAADTFRIDGE